MLKNLKKVISTIAAVAILATSASAFAVTFPDVDESASYAGAVELLVSLGVVNGDDNGKFNPDNTVTRAEFAKMVVEALGQGDAASKSSYTRFADAQGHWAAGYIEAGVAAEFINGYDENTFGPDDTVTYAQAVKMLVGAAGYESWAQMAGGWTAGYMSYGSSLGITTGVTGVNNDTELTRAQCAVLIANAMKAPLLVIDGYYFEGTMNGVVQVPNYVQMDETGEYWQTMLTEYHNAYEVKGRVMTTAKNGEKNGEVGFNIEDAKNFDDNYVPNGGSSAETFKVGATNAEDMLFEYASAVVVKDLNTNEFELAYIEKYGETKAIEFAAEDVMSINVAAANVKKSEMSADTKAYDLDNADVYVNGYKLSTITTTTVVDWTEMGGDSDAYDPGTDEDPVYGTISPITQANSYIGAANAAGTVTLINQTNTGSTATDNKYDYIMISFPESALVDSTRVTSTDSRIVCDAGAVSRFAFDPEDEDIEVSFIMDGEAIAFEDIQENDVITYYMDQQNGSVNLVNDSMVVYVTRNAVTGTVTRYNTEEVVIDGIEYAYNTGLFVAGDVSKEFTCYLDVNGVIVAKDVETLNVNYGVITKFAQNSNGKVAVTMITEDGETATYEVKNSATATAIADQLGVSEPTSVVATYSWNDLTSTGTTLDPDAVIAYKLSGGKLVLDTTPVNEVGAGATPAPMKYKENTGKLGSYGIDDTATVVLDLSSYIADMDEEVLVMSAAEFQDDFDYDAIVFDKNVELNAAQFIVITDGTNSLRPTSDLAIVKANVGNTVVDDTDVIEYVIAVNGEEKTVFITDDAPIAEGTIIMYPATSKEYIEYTKVATVFVPSATYADLLGVVTGGTSMFGEVKGDTTVNPDGIIATNTHSVESIVVGGNEDDEVKVYVGIAAKADFTRVDLMEDAVSGGTNINTLETINVKDANAYTFNYKYTADKGYRLEVAGSTASMSMFGDITNDATGDVDWSQSAAQQAFAPIVIAREIDGTVTDVFYFVAE